MFLSLADFPESHVVRVRADERDAKRIADHLLERFFEGEGAVGAFEAPDGSWIAEAHFPELPDKNAIAAAVAEIRSGAKPEYETLAAKDWIAASLEGLKIVRAGHNQRAEQSEGDFPFPFHCRPSHPTVLHI